MSRNKIPKSELKGFLDEKVLAYNQRAFIDSDPILIPHQFTKKEDIEISGFLMATFAWGQRKTIIKNGHQLLAILEHAPHDFVLNASQKELENIPDFKHRTFNREDLVFFLKSIQNIYQKQGSIEYYFKNRQDIKNNIRDFRDAFFSLPHQQRTQKHFSNPEKGASAKRLNMFLRWMVRRDHFGVDFGLWDVPASQLFCPLDVHSGNVARKLGLLQRKQNDWKAVEELTHNLRKFDPKDPVKYDYALFGLGVFEGF